jgi:hypothetical protein
VPFANVVPFRDGLMAGEIIYFDLATLCEQAGMPVEAVRAAAAQVALSLFGLDLLIEGIRSRSGAAGSKPRPQPVDGLSVLASPS